MSASESSSFFMSMASVVEDVLQLQGNGPRGLDFESRKAEEDAMRRYEAARWLRKMVGVVAAKDLPAEPSEEEFRISLRSGMILCNALNKVQPGAVPKVVESPNDCVPIPDGAALSVYQYFENVRNFLVAAQEIGLPTFEASDLEQGGIVPRLVNSVLALKSYQEWKLTGSTGVWKFRGHVKPVPSVKQYVRKNSEPVTNSLSRTSSLPEKSFDASTHDVDTNKTLVESILSKVVEEFEHRISPQNDLANKQRQVMAKDVSTSKKPSIKTSSDNLKTENKSYTLAKKQESSHGNHINDEQLKSRISKQLMIFDRQENDLQVLRHSLNTTKAGIQFLQTKFQEDLHNLGAHMYGLAQAASGYHKVLEENRHLHNQVQDLKGSIRVYCRVRPFLGGQSSYMSTVEHYEEGTITIRTPSKYGKGSKSFNFNKVFGPSATQAEVFVDMQPLIRSVLDGYNVCIFAYGQTGSGKTYTMSGPKELTEQTQGVNYRSLGDLFSLAHQRRHEFRYDVAVQMIEIYNEQVRDILVSDKVNKRLEIRNNSQNGLNVPEASLVPVSSTSDVIHLMNVGQRNRAVGATALNDRSSRSHSCLTVHVHGRDLTTGNVFNGCMHLVDLAGSERVDKSEVTGDRLKEAQHINKSLSALGDVISSLAQKNSHVPYRNSKLTQLLQDSLGGQAKTLMFVHISPEPEAIGETISTLKFAERVSTVELGAARVNKESADVKELKEQIASLKAALARKEGDSAHSPLPSKQNGGDALINYNEHRQPKRDVTNMEVIAKSTSRQNRQSFDLDESPSLWLPVNIPKQNYEDDEKEMDSSQWVDKIMVNKQESIPNAASSVIGWESDSDGRENDSFYQKCFMDGVKRYSEQSNSMFNGSNQSEGSNVDDLDELDAGTTDSSEPDLLWQFNHSKLPTFSNGMGSKTKKLERKTAKNPDLSKTPSRKLPNGTMLQKNGRPQLVSAEAKRRAGNIKYI